MLCTLKSIFFFFFWDLKHTAFQVINNKNNVLIQSTNIFWVPTYVAIKLTTKKKENLIFMVLYFCFLSVSKVPEKHFQNGIIKTSKFYPLQKQWWYCQNRLSVIRKLTQGLQQSEKLLPKKNSCKKKSYCFSIWDCPVPIIPFQTSWYA